MSHVKFGEGDGGSLSHHRRAQFVPSSPPVRAIVLLPLDLRDLSRLHDGHPHRMELPLWGSKVAGRKASKYLVRQMQQRVVLLEGRVKPWTGSVRTS